MKKKLELKICMGSSCFSRGNKELVKEIKGYIEKNHLEEKIQFSGARCVGLCSEGPVVIINDKTIKGVSSAVIEALLEEELAE